MLTPPADRYPSPTADMPGAVTDANKTGQSHSETLDIITEAGPQEVRYGYDLGADQPYWIDLPTPEGGRTQERFKTLRDYQLWLEQRTGFKIRTQESSRAITEPEIPAVRRAAPDLAPPEPPPPAPAPTKEPKVVDEILRLRAEIPSAEQAVRTKQAALEVAQGAPESARVDLRDSIAAYAQRVPKERWLTELDLRKPADRERVRDFLSRKPDVSGGEGTLADVRRKLRAFDSAELNAPQRIANAQAELAATEAQLAKTRADLEHWSKQTRIQAGQPLSPKLPEPASGYGYEPPLEKGDSLAQQQKKIKGYQTEIGLANHVADNLNEAVLKYAGKSGTHGSDVISVDAEGNVTLWDAKYLSSGEAHGGSTTFEGPPLENAIAEARAAVDASVSDQYTAAMRDKAMANMAKGNFTAYTVTSSDTTTFHSCRKLEFVNGVLVSETIVPVPKGPK
jgi:hypothetical protein